MSLVSVEPPLNHENLAQKKSICENDELFGENSLDFNDFSNTILLIAIQIQFFFK